MMEAVLTCVGSSGIYGTTENLGTTLEDGNTRVLGLKEEKPTY